MKKVLLSFLAVLAAAPAYAETSSFSRLLAAGQSVECSFSKPDGSQSGTVYTGQNKLRGDFQIKENGADYPMHIITDSEKMRTWGGPMGENQGMILPLNAQGAGPMGNSQAADMDSEMDFTCKSWPMDASKFEPPANVEFHDMSQLMSGALAAALQDNSN